jgi:hypothetical protein
MIIGFTFTFTLHTRYIIIIPVIPTTEKSPAS